MTNNITDNYINHQDVCSLLYAGYINEAILIFTNKTKELPPAPSMRRTYLSSLNYAIYNYILINENISLHSSCLYNEKKIFHSTSENLVQIGTEIIQSYGFDNHYLIEKYHNPHIKATVSYIHEHLQDSLTLKTVSEAAFIDKVYLCQLFKKEVHTSFHDYVLERRMKLATKLLTDTSLPIQTIAEQCGYKNASYFSTCYKKYTGQRPSEIAGIRNIPHVT